ncbi:class I SAM-dependent methyltransferase [Chthonobacter rhizosphaerae]|uniref:class I SAM-dependent methyltransferase n=1 Tax=Chthonobacter rhizosphaerae TaxID=2735553 RepID=UPI0015EEDDF5|nr:class I SAM-dependent methyltransferase [Chthonobacter rhizosphaerae]
MTTSAFSSAGYWDQRYRAGGTSGAGSMGVLARYKAAFLNRFVADNAVAGVVELGCGDGQQLALYDFPAYTGLDVSPTIVARCQSLFAGRPDVRFLTTDRIAEVAPAPLSMSIDVIFHLVEDDVFHRYMTQLFGLAERYVVVYSSNVDLAWRDRHVRHRRLTDHVLAAHPSWSLAAHLPNLFPYDPARPDETSFADFFVFRRDRADPVRIAAPGLADLR